MVVTHEKVPNRHSHMLLAGIQVMFVPWPPTSDACQERRIVGGTALYRANQYRMRIPDMLYKELFRQPVKGGTE